MHAEVSVPAQRKARDTVTTRRSNGDPDFKPVVARQRAWSKLVAKLMILSEAAYPLGYEHRHSKIPGLTRPRRSQHGSGRCRSSGQRLPIQTATPGQRGTCALARRNAANLINRPTDYR